MNRRSDVDMNPHYLTVPCHYCGADRMQPCRNTMLDGRPVTDTHRMRIQYAEEVPWLP